MGVSVPYLPWYPQGVSKSCRVMIVEDVDTMRDLLKQTVEALPGFRVVGTASNTVEARRALSRNRPELLLLDEVLPGESSLDLLAEVVGLGITVVLVTGSENPGPGVPPGAKIRLRKPGWKKLPEDFQRFQAELLAVWNSVG